MADSYDGSIKIDTRVDSKSFNTGMKKLSSSAGNLLSGVMNIVTRFGTAVKSVFSALGGVMKASVIGMLLLMGATLVKTIQDIAAVIPDLLKRVGLGDALESIKGHMEELKVAFANIFLPLAQFVLPLFEMFLSWLVKVFNFIALITAALFGQKKALQVVVGSAAKLAKETQATEKAARGALAAFDQIDTLNLGKDATQPDALKVETQLVDVTPDLIKQSWHDLIQDIMDAWGMFAGWMKTNVIDPVWNWFKTTWIWKEVIEPLKNWFAETWENLKLGATVAWLFVSNAAGIAAAMIRAKWEELKAWFIVTTTLLSANILLLWENVKKGFNGAVDWIGTKFRDVFVGIQNFAQTTINNIIGFINNLVASILGAIAQLSGLGTAGASASVNLGGVSGSVGSRVPHLATGAVVPAHANMLAMVGEGSQSEVVAPENMIRSIVNEALANTPQNVTIKFTGTGADIARLLKPELDRVNRQIGKSLIAGGTV